MSKRKFPKTLYRGDDELAFHLNGGFNRHTYSALIKLGFKQKLKDCKIVPVKRTNSPCGDDE